MKRSSLVDDLIFERQIEELRESVRERFRSRSIKTKFIQVAAHAFIGLVSAWELNESEAAKLLGISECEYLSWQIDCFEGFGEEEFEKISCLLGIYKYLMSLYSGHQDRTRAWLMRTNHGQIFRGKSPFEFLCGSAPNEFYIVRRLVAAETV